MDRISIIRSNTGMCFAWRCLSIAEDGAINAIKCLINNLTANSLVHLGLWCVALEYAIECKIMRLFGIFLLYCYVLISHARYTTFVVFLFIIERTDANKYAYILISFGFASRCYRIIWHSILEIAVIGLIDFYNSIFGLLILEFIYAYTQRDI